MNSVKEFVVKGKSEKRTERESLEKTGKVAELLVLPRPVESLQNSASFSRKT